MEYKDIPTYNIDFKEWSTTSFENKEKFKEFLWSIRKEVGKYGFCKESNEVFSEKGDIWEKNGNYINAPQGSRDFKKYWLDEREKCMKGLIVIMNSNVWYLTREYYMWLNYLPIFFKDEKKYKFPRIYDGQYHTALTEKYAFYNNQHFVMLKKRQYAMSFYHIAKLINSLWFDAGVTLKLLASDDSYINLDGDWKFVEDYKNFLNTHTAWTRPFSPESVGNLIQRVQDLSKGVNTWIGLQSRLINKTVGVKPTNGVGGACLKKGTLVYKSDYTLEQIQNIKVDDYVLGKDLKPKKVLKVFHGNNQFYKIKSNKNIYEVTENHILHLKNIYTDKIEEYTPVEFLKLSEWKRTKALRGMRVHVPFDKISTSTITVEKSNVDEYFGFECEDHLFILKDGTVTHNSEYIMYEEAGVAPKLDKTYGYARNGVEDSNVLTGQFIAFGAVGDLKQCDPLKEYMKSPIENGFFGEETLLYDGKKPKVCGYFIPESWNYGDCQDKFGNSNIEKAVKTILNLRKQWEKDLTPTDYQLKISQGPLTIVEAFDFREVSFFPPDLIKSQYDKIENGEFPYETCDPIKTEQGIKLKYVNREPMGYPVEAKQLDKRGCLQVWERPKDNLEWDEYIASLDPIATDKTTSSNSLCSLIIYKNPILITRENNLGEIENIYEGGKIVAEWTGRFDSVKETYEYVLMILQLYKARCIVENNITNFITFMIEKHSQMYLIPSSEMIFIKEKELIIKPSGFGWKNSGKIFRDVLLPYVLSYITEEKNAEFDEKGNKTSVTFGINSIPSRGLILEMQAWREGINVDRLISFSALCAYLALRIANNGILRKHTVTKKINLEERKKLNNLIHNPFPNISNSLNKKTFKHQIYKNLR